MTEREKNLVVTLWQSGEPIEKIIRLLPYPIGISRRYIRELREQGVLTKSNRNKITAKEKIIEIYNNGTINPYDIAEISGYSFYTVRYVLSHAGLCRVRPVHNYKTTSPMPYERICDNSKQIVDLLERGMGCAEIAKIVGCTRQNVFILKKKFYPEKVRKEK